LVAGDEDPLPIDRPACVDIGDLSTVGRGHSGVGGKLVGEGVEDVDCELGSRVVKGDYVGTEEG
jgi:hypothetical protein